MTNQALPHTANCCTARWSGYNTAHCSVCHETFTSITAFDKHRTGAFTEAGESIIDKGKTEPRGPRRCLSPASVGLVVAERAYPCWGLDGKDPRFTRDDSDVA